MEKLLSINWDKNVDETQSFFSQDKFCQSSAAFHQIHGILQSPWPFTEHWGKVKGVEDLNAHKWNPFNLKREVIDGPGGQGEVVQVELPKPLPKKSSLSADQQRDYYFCLLRIYRAFLYGKESNPCDMVQFKEFHDKLKEEMNEFQNFAKVLMLQNPSSYTNLNPGVAKYVSEAWQQSLKRVTTYSKCYTNQGELLLIPKENIKTLDLVLENNLLELGSIPGQIFPQVNKVIKLQRHFKAMNKRFPTARFQKDHNKVSSDINGVRLASKYEADVVVSSETLKTLAVTMPPYFKRDWTIPFNIITGHANGKNRKLIIFDDPLPPTTMSGYEKNNFFNRFAVKYQFTNFIKARYYSYPGTKAASDDEEDDEQESDDDIFDASKTYSDSIDTFGVDETPSKSILTGSKTETKENVGSPRTTAPALKAPGTTEKNQKELLKDSVCSDSDSSETSLQIDLDEDEDSPSKSQPSDSASPPKKKKTCGNKGLQQASTRSDVTKSGRIQEESNILGAILMEQEKLIPNDPNKALKKAKNSGNKEDPRSYIPPQENENLSYKTWLLKANQKSYRLLVRTSVDTAIVTPSGEVRTFVMAAKSEYQPWFGAECLTPQELFETWMDMHLRPGTRLFRARVDAYSGDFMTSEQKDETCLKREINFQYGDHFRFEQPLNTIWSVISSLRDMDLPVGSYLLRHNENGGISAQVLRSTEDERSTFNLHDEYANIDTGKTAIRDPNEQWIAIDPFMVLPVHRALERPPATFEPPFNAAAGRSKHGKKQPPGKKNKQNQANKKTPKNTK